MIKTTIQQLYRSKYVQTVFARRSLRDHHKQQWGALAVVTLIVLVLLSTAGYRWLRASFIEAPPAYLGAVPVDINDAISVCDSEMRSRLGDEFLRSYVDQHSTRLDDSKSLFRIYIKADIGEVRDFREIDIYCFVDKWDQSIAHYKQVDPSLKRILSSDLKFFKD